MTILANLKLWAALLAAMIAITVVLVVEARPTHGAFPGKNGQIAFSSNRGVVDPDKAHRRST